MKHTILFNILCVAVFFVIPFSSTGQEFNRGSQYLVNPSALAPAYNGILNDNSIWFNYRREWTGVNNSPKTYSVGGFTPLTNSTSLGGRIVSDNHGVYRLLKIEADYSVHLQLANEHGIHFSLSGYLFQNRISFSDVQVAHINDPLLNNGRETHGTSFNAGASIIYQFKQMYFGATLPVLIKRYSEYGPDEENNLLLLNQSIHLFANPNFELDKDWILRTYLIYSNRQEYPANFQVAALINYKKGFRGGLYVQRNAVVGLTAGLDILEGLGFQYAYEFSNGTNAGQLNSTHEVTFIYNFDQRRKTRWSFSY
ncbi:MAG: PorP/SprF family type IX secretion system membrane protein [Bacteroidales bacterium]|nr:PorP/SprF family type IX secretion system membrane protein [Bacteroidales bacterium]